jgi:hypothetical protein
MDRWLYRQHKAVMQLGETKTQENIETIADLCQLTLRIAQRGSTPTTNKNAKQDKETVECQLIVNAGNSLSNGVEERVKHRAPQT